MRGFDRVAWTDALRAVWPTFWLSRVLVMLVAVYAALKLAPAGDASGYTPPGAQRPLPDAFGGGLLDLILGPLARWDAGYYLSIAESGYVIGGSVEDPSRFAFFPLYPFTTKALSLFTGDPGFVLIAAVTVSLLACLAAFAILHRLVELETDRETAGASVLLLAVFPTAFFLGVPYTESLFLALSLGAFYAARTDHWAAAGMLAGAATLTRSTGVALLVPLVVMLGRPRKEALWLLIVPAALALWSIHCHRAAGDAFVWMEVQNAVWRREGFPLSGIWEGAEAAWQGLLQVVDGDRSPNRWPVLQGDPLRNAAVNLTDFVFTAAALGAIVGCLRRLPLAYGLYAAAALVLPLSSPAVHEPLQSMPRYVLVAFPLFIWLAIVARERNWTRGIAVSFAVGLGVLTAQFATLQWVA